MANPSRATIQTGWSNAIKILNQLRLFGNINATNFLSLLNTAQTTFAGDYGDDYFNTLQALRGSLATTVSQGLAAAVQRSWLQQYCKSVIGKTDLANDQQMWQELYRYMIDNSLRVDSRRMTFGSSVAGTNTGTMQIVRLTKDEYNFDIESGYGDSKRILCIADQNTGTQQGNEQWQIIGQAKARDELERSGSGLEGTLFGTTIDDSLLNNPGFRSFGGTAGSDAPTSLTSWTSNQTFNSTNFGIDQTNTFRTAPSDGTAGSLTVKTSATLTQKLTVRGTDLSNTTPYVLAVIWNRAVNSATGTLTARMGTISTAVTVSAQTGWVVTTVPNPMGQSAWYRLFAQDDLQIQLQWAQTGGTGLLIAEVLLVPATFFDGLGYWMFPSSAAAWIAPRVNDSFTIADGESSSGGVNQRWFARGFGTLNGPKLGYLPHINGSSITWTDA